MLPTLCAILAAPQQHSSILLDGCLELATLALAPSPPDAARSIHAAATPAVLQVGGGALPTRNSLRSCCVWKLGGPPSLVPRSALCRSLRGQGHRCIAYTSLFHLLPRSPTRVPPPPPFVLSSSSSCTTTTPRCCAQPPPTCAHCCRWGGGVGGDGGGGGARCHAAACVQGSRRGQLCGGSSRQLSSGLLRTTRCPPAPPAPCPRAQVGGADALAWPGVPDFLGALLGALQRLLQPGLEDRACSLAGALILELLRHAGQHLVGGRGLRMDAARRGRGWGGSARALRRCP
jgi:hypothetical protein